MRTAFYECDITPPLGCYIPGHGKEVRAVDVADRLYAKAVVIEDNGCIAALVAVDTVIIPTGMHEAVTKRVCEFTGIEPHNICICSNHSHAGAPIASSPTTNDYADSPYMDIFFRLAADAIILAYKRLDDATAKFGEKEVEGIGFSRTFILDDGSYVTHGRSRTNIVSPFGKVDNALSVILFEKMGKPIGAIINYAVHQCSMNKLCDHYSGDYSSVISKKLKEVYGNDFVSLFIIGCCGDVNHVNPEIKNPPPYGMHVEIGEMLAKEVLEVISNAEDTTGTVGVVKKPLVIKKRMPDKEFLKKKTQELIEMNYFGRVSGMLYYASANKTDSEIVYVQAIRMGNTCIYALPGEIFAETGLSIKDLSPFKNNMVSELTNTPTGYIPPARAFGEHDKLYETSLCFHSCLVPEAEEMIINAAVDAAKELKG